MQALPVSLRSRAIDAIASTVAPGGTLVVVSGIHSGDGPRTGPPWELTREELDRFAWTLRPVEVGVARIGDAARWRAEYTAP